VDVAWNSTAALAVAPLQDLLNLGTQSRMNIPGRPSGNWRWRFPGDLASLEDFRWLRDLTEISKRVEPETIDPQTIDPEKIDEPKNSKPSGDPIVTVSEAV